MDEDHYSRLFTASPVAQALSDEHGHLVEMNPAYCVLVGMTPQDLIGQSARIHTHPEDWALHSSVGDLMAAGRSADRPVAIEARFVRPTGEIRWALLTLIPFVGPHDAEWTMAAAVDITSRKELEDGIFRASRTDQLTGALNRRGWADHAVDAIENNGALDTVVTVLDLDHFKGFNDRYGHAAGDRVLIEFVTAVRDCIGSGDVLARWGGEEFVITLHDCDRKRALDVLQRLAHRTPEGLTFSAGYTRQRAGEGLRHTLERADSLMFQAKRQGRNRMVTDAPG
nr:sensor domain-containing diguanylate cyclase [Rhodococcus sp. (in: high G+C Gram-positive bacteria)]